ncbi:hypothetical protein ACIBL8_21730 [Streptomyces sp. NPDC050523]|uniref:hypothetical protein n=1 Tax=Streptomyces sp. NPDC050523 TaxID=3365622 RepID=UPI0037AFBB06
MSDAESRLRLAAESLNREALAFDADAFTQRLLGRLGIARDGCAGDSSIRAGRPPQAGSERGGRRRDSDSPSHDEFFNLELDELVNNTTLHTQPRVLRRIAELNEYLGHGAEAREWWIRAADGGDQLAKLTVEEWRGTASGPGRRQAHGS